MPDHRALREAAEDGTSRLDASLLPERVEPPAHQRIGRREGPGVRIADLLHRVPVGAAGEPQRAARRHPEEASSGVEEVEERVQVGLVGAAPVRKSEQAVRLGRGQAGRA